MTASAAQLLLNALALGAAYALVALGFVLVLNAVGAVNFAQGDLVMAGGFAAALIGGQSALPGLAVLPLVMLAMAGLGLVLCAVAYAPLAERPPTAVFISTIAVALLLQHGATAALGPEPRAAPPLVGGGAIGFAGLSLSEQQLWMIVTAAALVGGLHLLLERTQLGRRLRATAQDRTMARALGIPVAAMIALSFALAAALAGAAGALLAHQYYVTPSEGGVLMLKAYIAATIGGWGRLGGAVLGAMLIALFEVVVSAAISYVVAEALLYLLLLALLRWRPEGLLGETAGRRA